MVNSSSAIGPRACSFCVLIATSAPSPIALPSVKRVLAFQYTAAESTSLREALGVFRRLGQDAVRMLCAVPRDMRNRLVDIIHYFEIERQIVPLGIKVISRRPHYAFVLADNLKCARIRVEFHTLRAQNINDPWQQISSDSLMNQQRFHRIADRWPLCLGVVQNRYDPVQTSARIDEDMTHADSSSDHRYAAVFSAECMQAIAAARNNHINVFVQPQHFADIAAIGAVDVLNGIGRKSCSARTSCNIPVSAILLLSTSDPPRRITALLVFSASVEMSTVTFGLDSYIAPKYSQRCPSLEQLQTILQSRVQQYFAYGIG